MSGELIIADILPSELAQMVWDYIPLRTRATTCKSLFEKHYSELIGNIPRFEPYVLSLIRDESCSYIFRLIIERKFDHWMQLGRWVTHGWPHAGVYDTYISYLVHRCRVEPNPKCLREIPSMQWRKLGKRISSWSPQGEIDREEWGFW
jgi:hypothetical protein